MKDYSFGNVEYRKSFICGYKISEDGKSIIINYANRRTETISYTLENEKKIIATMYKQINEAYKRLESTLNSKEMGVFKYIKTILALKLKEKDIIKNKMLIDNEKYLNSALNHSKQWVLELPKYLQDILIWNLYDNQPYFDFKNIHRNTFEFNLNSINHFSLNDLEKVMNCIEDYGYPTARTDYKKERK